MSGIYLTTSYLERYHSILVSCK